MLVSKYKNWATEKIKKYFQVKISVISSSTLDS